MGLFGIFKVVLGCMGIVLTLFLFCALKVAGDCDSRDTLE